MNQIDLGTAAEWPAAQVVCPEKVASTGEMVFNVVMGAGLFVFLLAATACMAAFAWRLWKDDL